MLELIILFLSLYSTATQNTLRRGLALGNAPDARILCWGYQHVGIFETTQTLKFASPPTQNLKFVFYPTQNPNTSQWNIGCIGSQCKNLVSCMYISCCLCPFHLRFVANANPVSSGIWACKDAYTCTCIVPPSVVNRQVPFDCPNHRGSMHLINSYNLFKRQIWKLDYYCSLTVKLHHKILKRNHSDIKL